MLNRARIIAMLKCVNQLGLWICTGVLNFNAQFFTIQIVLDKSYKISPWVSYEL